jgi:hypothetical protein
MQGEYLLVSMKSPKRIREALRKYALRTQPQSEDAGSVSRASRKKAPGDSATLLWSGEVVNTRLALFHKARVGYVLNPQHLECPQADFIAFNSKGRVAAERAKNGWLRRNVVSGDVVIHRSKYSKKKAYARTGSPDLATNYATFLRPLNDTDASSGEQLAKGSLDAFSLAVLWKYRKGHRRFNEAITFQKGEHNPIDGLLIHGTDALSEADRDGLLQLLEERPSLKLYIYDNEASTHIMRWMPSEAACRCLQSVDLQCMFKLAQPFTGFDALPQSEQVSGGAGVVADEADQCLQVKLSERRATMFSLLAIPYGDAPIDSKQSVPVGITPIAGSC